MYENINELIEINLKLLFESNDQSLFFYFFQDENGKNLRDPKRFSEYMENKELINIEYSKRERCTLTEFGYKIYQHGGWKKYLADVELIEENERIEKESKEQLEVELAKSNIEANKLNVRIAEQNSKNEKKNRLAMWINIAIGMVNIGLIVWQIFKD